MTESNYEKFENQGTIECDCGGDWDNEIRLDKIDEVMARTKLSFSEAKAVLEKYEYDIVEALAAIDEAKQAEYEEAKQKIRERYEDAKDFSREKYEELKAGGLDGYNNMKNKIKEKDLPGQMSKVRDKAKAAVSAPVRITKGGKEVPAGIFGAGLASLLYPLHKSKGVAAAGLTVVGAWLINKGKNNPEMKDGIKNAVDGFSRNISESFSGWGKGESECFTIHLNNDGTAVQTDNAENAAGKDDEE